MDGGYLHGQQFLGLEEMMQVGLGVDAIDVATIGVDGRKVVLPLLVAHVHGALVGEEHGIATITGGHHTVEHVDATFDGLEDVLWSTHTHEVSRTILGQDVVDHLDHIVHHLGGFANGQTSNRGATTIVELSEHVADMLGGILTQVFIGAALYDGEERLAIAIEGLRLVETLHASLQPTLCKPQTISGILIVALAWRALVEGHHDIGSDGALGIHHILGGEEVF